MEQKTPYFFRFNLEFFISIWTQPGLPTLYNTVMEHCVVWDTILKLSLPMIFIEIVCFCGLFGNEKAVFSSPASIEY